MQQLTDEIGVDQMGEVLAAVSNRSLAYQSGGSSDTTTDAADWQRFLDLVERIGGSETAHDLMVRHVIQSKDRHLLQKRDAALDDMKEAAKELGADGIVGIDFDYEVLGETNGMMMVAVSGTAVKMA